jgi:hypothetical protein
MRPSAKLLSIALVALFWTAQIQATAHGIAHIQTGSGLQDQAPTHSLLCADCAAFAQAGAAPVTVLKPPPFTNTTDRLPAFAGSIRLERPAALGFRSRAPPTASI